MSASLILYSTNTWLAYKIAERFYGDVHHVWCAPFFDSDSIPSYQNANPPSSNPSRICRELFEAVSTGDRHSMKIRNNQAGIRRGAKEKKNAGIITGREEKEIRKIVDKAEIADFRPLVYVIPYSLVVKMVEAVSVEKRAHPLSIEYVIKKLPRKFFDVIEWKWR